MPRPPKKRKIDFLPDLTYFKPAGVPLKELQEVSLGFEELEAIRLKDLEGLEQEACANHMGVSRPTFHRIIVQARHKLARALIEGKAIRIEGGNYLLSQHMLHCFKCGFTGQTANAAERMPGKCSRERISSCPSCGAEDLQFSSERSPLHKDAQAPKRRGRKPPAENDI